MHWPRSSLDRRLGGYPRQPTQITPSRSPVPVQLAPRQRRNALRGSPWAARRSAVASVVGGEQRTGAVETLGGGPQDRWVLPPLVGLYDETTERTAMTQHIQTVLSTQTLDVPGATSATTSVTSRAKCGAGAADDRRADGRRGLHDPGRAFPRPDGRHLRPARGRAQREDRRRQRVHADEHADDLHRLISALGAGPVDIFASSGGAVNGLVLVARHPEQVRTLVAHEPPAAQALPDREQALAAAVDIHETYQREGLGPAMAKFIALTGLKGPIPADFADRPAPNPADFGLPTEDDGSRDDPMFGRTSSSRRTTSTTSTHCARPRHASSIAAGAESEGEMAHRAALAIAEQLGTEAVIFPSHHGGFLGGEFGMRGDPEAFAAILREVLTNDR